MRQTRFARWPGEQAGEQLKEQAFEEQKFKE